MNPFVPLSNAALSPWQPGLTAILLYLLLIFMVLAAILVLTKTLGGGASTAEKLRSYESGIIPVGTARFSYPAPFYLVAVFFLIFDIETAYILTWAIAFRQLGWAGWLQICCFIVVLLGSLFYIWKKGGLTWGGG